MSDGQQAARLRHDQLRTQLAKLDKQESNLLDLAADGLAATAKIRERLRDIEQQPARLQAELTPVATRLDEGASHLRTAMRLLHHLGELYERSEDAHRRDLNQAVFEKLYVYDEAVQAVRRDVFAEFGPATPTVAGTTKTPSSRRASGSTRVQSTTCHSTAVYWDRLVDGSSKAVLVGVRVCD